MTTSRDAPGGQHGGDPLDLAAELPELRDARPLRRLAYILGAFMILAVGWAALSPVREVTTGKGTITTEATVARIEHRHGGTVTEVAARAGTAVEAGHPLVRLDARDLRSQRETLLARRERLEAESGRVSRVLEDADAATPPREGGTSRADRLFWAEQTLVSARLSLLDAEADGLRNRIEGLTRERRSLRSEAGITRAAADRLAGMAERGIVRRTEHETAQRQSMRADRATLENAAASTAARDALRATELKRGELLSARFRDAAERSNELDELLTGIGQDLGRIDARIEGAVIRAPVAGYVQVIAVAGEGDVILPGELVAEIVPDGSPIQAEVEIAADDIGNVALGMDAGVKVTTFDFAWFGKLAGQVSSITPTSAVNETGQTVYAVTISLGAEGADGAALRDRLRPGMTVSADVVGGAKSVLAYLFKPLRSLRDGAFTEF